MAKKIQYKGEMYEDNEDLVNQSLDMYHMFYEKWIIGFKKGMISVQKAYIKGRLLLENNEYLIFKQEIEELLKNRNLREIKRILNIGRMTVPSYEDPKKNAQFLERVYYDVYHDQPEFRKELIKTDINELLEIKF